MRFIIGFLALPLAFAAPVFEPRDGEDVVPDKWIVVMKSGISTSQLESTISSAQQQPGARQAHEVWDFDGFKGFSITGSRDAINTIADDNTIELIEPDSIVTTQSLVTQPDSTWGLSRISHRNPFQLGYPYDSTAGKGMVAYGIDTGIYIKHHEFQGRAVFGHSFVPGQKGDGHGHGTHTAGTIGGVTYGVAKNITLVAVKVLDNSGSGPNSQVISGIEWAVKDMKKRKAVGKAVANLSLAGPRAAVVNRAVKAATDAGLFMAVAAGNNAEPAAQWSPASAPTACTVGATDIFDEFAYFSNYGPELDILGPGVDVTSAWIGSPDAINTISGTSMATPHIAGLAAYLLKLEGPRKPVALCSRLKALSTKGKVTGLSGLQTVNQIAYNGIH